MDKQEFIEITLYGAPLSSLPNEALIDIIKHQQEMIVSKFWKDNVEKYEKLKSLVND